MNHPLRIGLMVRPQALPVDRLLGVFEQADEAGFDHVWLFDHLVSIPEPTLPVFDSWTLLAAAARVTQRCRIGLQVTGNLYRHPSMLAKQVVTVDHLAGGRVEMGLGAGWNEPEFRMHGMPFPSTREAIERLDEACAVLKALWSDGQATFDGRYYQLADAIAEPKPIQRPHPPLWIGGSGRKLMLRVVARRCLARERVRLRRRRRADARAGRALRSGRPRSVVDTAQCHDPLCRPADGRRHPVSTRG
jgi:alkanesulfonate monooxygenase SsuD/methylene tetrahydromethanopterin reductase-like flavin-dependent oxidoreductase (luciferase family)